MWWPLFIIALIGYGIMIFFLIKTEVKSRRNARKIREAAEQRVLDIANGKVDMYEKEGRNDDDDY